MTFEPLTFGSLFRKLEDKLILFDAKMLEPLTFVSLFGKKSLVQLFFGACCVCFGEKVLSVEQKNFFYFHNKKTEMFSQFDTTPTMIKLLKLNCGTKRLLYQMWNKRLYFIFWVLL